MADLYTPLDIESYQIRMLFLHPGPKGSMIQCELQRHALVNPPKYTALSYCWGDEAKKRPIMVGDIQVMVTVNLEEALQQLREHQVTLLWVDALCINQLDKQEKSLQVRNMKQVYARAEAVYAWLGPSDHDNVLSAIRFLYRVTSDVSLLQITSHSHIVPSAMNSEESILVSKEKVYTESLSCQRCQVELSFQALLDLFNRPYWRRRWVIQEVTTAANSRVVCGSESLNLDNMSDVLDRCSKSKYWQPQHRSAYRFLQKILNFRKAYHDDKHLKLCRTILLTRDFLSKDGRDKVFALIGICKDGTELVPTPSYDRSVEHVAAEITRELLRRNARFDLILVDQRNRCTLTSQISTWSPDWFSEHLPESACVIAEEEPYLSRRHGVRSLQGDISALHVQGIEVGTVVASTSILNPSSHPLPTPARTLVGRMPSVPLKSNYYGQQTLAAILTCLLASSTIINSPMATNGSVHRHYLLQAIQPPAEYTARDPEEKKQQPAHSLHLHQWLLQNGEFMVHGRRLQDWMQVSHCWYYLQLPYIIFRLLPLGLCVTTVALAVPGIFVGFSVAATTTPLISSSITWLVVVITINAFTLLFSMVCTWTSIHKVKMAVRQAVECSPQISTRLILMDSGVLGMASSDVEVGDKICLIAGCKHSAAVLREKQVGDRTQHKVVGRSMVCMSKKDEQKHRAFFGTGTPPVKLQKQPTNLLRAVWPILARLNPFRVYGDFQEIEAEKYNQLIDEYRLRSEWKEFVLV